VGSRILGAESFSVSLGQALREDVDVDGDGLPDWIMIRDLTIPGRAHSGTAFFDLSGDGAFGALDASVPGATITLDHKDLDFAHTATADADGEFALPAVPAGSYAVSVTADGRTVSAADVDLSESEDRRDVAVPFGTLSGFVRDDDGGALAGAKVEVLDETTGATSESTTESDGGYEARPFLEGNYTVTATSGDLAGLPGRLRITPGTVELNLTLVPSGRVAGVTRLFGTDLPFASLEFQRTSEVRQVRTVRSDAAGAFQAILAAGDWNVNGRLYQGTSVYALLGQVTVRAGETTSLIARFVEGARIEGTVNGTAADGPEPRAQIAFLGASGNWWIRTGAGGHYLAFLPLGEYGVEAFSAVSAFYGNVTLSSSRAFDLQMTTAESATARVFRDVNADGVSDPGEGVASAVVRLADDLGRRVLAVTDANGTFQIIGFSNRTYGGTIEAVGYVPTAIARTALSGLRTGSPYAIVARPVDVRGAVLLSGTPILNRELTIEARAIGEGAIGTSFVTDSNGGYAASLAPGRYELVVDENVSTSSDWRYQNRATEELRISVGSGDRLRDLEVVVRARVTGNVTRDVNGNVTVATSVAFDGPDIRTVASPTARFEVYLQPGTYSVSIFHSAPPNELAFLDDIDLAGPVHLSLRLVNATTVSGLALFRNVAVPTELPISFVRQEGGRLAKDTTGTGSYSTTLVPGTYAVTVDAARTLTEGGLPRFYRFTFDGTLVVSDGVPTITFHVDLERTLDNTTLGGRVTRDGLGVDASLLFFARGGGAIDAEGSSALDGSYTVGLAPGDYEVYATRSLGSAAFLGSLSLPHAAAFAFDVSLRPAFVLSGVVTDASGERTAASVTIVGEARLELSTDGSGAYARLLPGGTYTVTATASGTERGIAVEYRASSTVSLASGAVVNLRLAKVERRGATLTWDPATRESVSPGGTVVYSVSVRNTGNVPDTFRMSGRPSDWTFTFSPASVDLNFGTSGSSATVTVTIRAPADAQVVHAPTQVVATSSDGTTTGIVNTDIDVRRTRGLALQVLASSPTFDGRILAYTVEVRNPGNAQEAVTLYVANVGDLASSGWTAAVGLEGGLAPSSSRLETFPVGANGTTRVILHLTSASGPSGVTVVLQALLDDVPTITATTVFVAQLPSLSSTTGVQASGPNVARQATPPATLLSVAVAAALGAAVALLLTRRRR
jgi:hypothetical protein